MNQDKHKYLPKINTANILDDSFPLAICYPRHNQRQLTQITAIKVQIRNFCPYAAYKSNKRKINNSSMSFQLYFNMKLISQKTANTSLKTVHRGWRAPIRENYDFKKEMLIFSTASENIKFYETNNYTYNRTNIKFQWNRKSSSPVKMIS
jgi:hypothetical protein